MQLNQLRSFIAIAREQNLTRAAETVHLSQSAVSNQIKLLEEELGVQLFRRTSKSMLLTDAGQALLIYARNVLNFDAGSGGTALRWDKIDWDTWRVFPAGSGTVTVTFDYGADALDTGSSWTAPDFAFFNGTNLFLYPEGQGYDFSSRVTFRTEPTWRVATGMTPGAGFGEYVAARFPRAGRHADLHRALRHGRRRDRRRAAPPGHLSGGIRRG